MSRSWAAARLLPEITVCMPNQTTQQGDLQGKRRYGSDGTRTRARRIELPGTSLA
jgi:hypothetical protein